MSRRRVVSAYGFGQILGFLLLAVIVVAIVRDLTKKKRSG